MKRLTATDEKIILTIDKMEELLQEFNSSSATNFKTMATTLNQFRQDLLLLKEINKISSSLSINDSFEDVDNEISNALDDLTEQYGQLKQSLSIIKERLLIVRDIK